MLNKFTLSFKLFAGVLFIGILFAFIIWRITVNNSSEIIYKSTEKELINAAEIYSAHIESELELAIETARGLSRVSRGYEKFPEPIRRDVIKNIIKTTVEQNQHFLCVWGVFELNSIDNLDSKYMNKSGSTDKGRFCPSFFRNGSKGIEEEATVYNDNELIEEEYFDLPKKRNQETILEPYFYA